MESASHVAACSDESSAAVAASSHSDSGYGVSDGPPPRAPTPTKVPSWCSDDAWSPELRRAELTPVVCRGSLSDLLAPLLTPFLPLTLPTARLS